MPGSFLAAVSIGSVLALHAGTCEVDEHAKAPVPGSEQATLTHYILPTPIANELL